MATANIKHLYCVSEATGTDIGAITAIANLATTVVPSDFEGIPLLDGIRSLPGVIAAIDQVRSDPDDLFMTFSTDGSIDNKVWPTDGRNTVPMLSDQSESPMLQVDLEFSQNVSLWDKDLSANDLLGSVTILAAEAGQGDIAKKAFSTVENSIYYVVYSVE